MKTCSKCGFPKNDNCFYNGKSWCIECHKKKNNAYYAANKEYIISRVHEYATKNQDKIKENKKQYYEENKETILEEQKAYYENNFDRIRVVKETYRLIHKEERNKNQKARYENDPSFRLRMNLSTAISGFLKRSSSSKNGNSCSEYLSYTMSELKEHLEKQFESWMTWENQGRYDRETWDDNDSSTWTWQIDHIIPHSSLPYTSMSNENFKKCWALDNLRPLSAKQNLIDGNRKK